MTRLLLAEYATSHDAAAAAAKAAEAGHPCRDVLSPLPIPGAADRLAPRHAHKPIGWVMVIAGTLGAAIGYGMQWYSAVIAYPIISGGRPLNSWPAFLLVPYETAILGAGVIGLLGWMWLCGLPKLFHPLFEAQATARVVQDSYLLVFEGDDALAGWISAELAPGAVHEVVP
jgi:hypothetical protein